MSNRIGSVALVCVVVGFLAAGAPGADACVGARALSMGGAFTGLADDVSATYWNPAALVDLEVDKGAATWMRTANNREFINYQDYLAVAGHAGSNSAAGVSYIKFRLDPLWEQNWYWVSVATRVGPQTSVGANVKFINDSVNVPGASVDTDTAFDLAVYHHASENVTVGLLVQDVNEPETSGFVPGLGSGAFTWVRNWRPGVAVRLPEGVTLSAELYDATDEVDRAVRFGVEKRFLPPQPDTSHPTFAVRAGWYGNADALTLGAGWRRDKASVDVALMTGDLDNTWFVSASGAW